MPSTPEATIAYSCQLVNIAPNPPCEKYVVIPFIRAAVSPKADPPAIPKTAAWWALLPWLPPPRPGRPPPPPEDQHPDQRQVRPDADQPDVQAYLVRPAGGGGEEVEQAREARRHRQYRAPFPWPHAGLEHPGREDQRERQLQHQDGLDDGQLPRAQRGGLEQEAHRDGEDPEEPDRLVQQAPDQLPAQVLFLRDLLVGLALQHR
jgi:hypothetical protein